jgi:hypothetical protein
MQPGCSPYCLLVAIRARDWQMFLIALPKRKAREQKDWTWMRKMPGIRRDEREEARQRRQKEVCLWQESGYCTEAQPSLCNKLVVERWVN